MNGKELYQIADELFGAYCRHKRTAKAMSKIAVRLFQGSNSFAEASQRLRNLEELTVWDASFSEKIAEAAEINNRIPAFRRC